jgi:hypothetical protein
MLPYRSARTRLSGLLAVALIAGALVVMPGPAKAQPVEMQSADFRTSSERWLTFPSSEKAQEGDLLLAVISATGRAEVTAPSGWQLVRTDRRANELTQTVWSRYAGSPEDEAGGVKNRWTDGSSQPKSGALLVFRNGRLNGGSDVTSGAASHQARPIAAPSVSAEEVGGNVVGLFSMRAHGRINAPDGMAAVGAGVQGEVSVAVATAVPASTGPTGERTATRSVAGGAVGQLLFIASHAVPDDGDQEHDDHSSEEPSDEHGPNPEHGPDDPAPDDPGGEEPSHDPDDTSQGPNDEGDPSDQSPGDPSNDEPVQEPAEDHESPDPETPPDPHPGPEHGDHTQPEPARPEDESTPTAPVQRWSDPTAWPEARVPSFSDDVTIDGHVVVDGVAQAQSVTVPSGSTLEFAPDSSGQLELGGNLVIEGVLRMHPARHEVDHLVRFVGVDESKYVGGGHVVRGSDVGLWFTGAGTAQINGSERLAWTRAAASLSKGTTVLPLEDVPTGWQAGDEIAVSPTSSPGTAGHSDGYSYGRIVALDGASMTIDTPLAYGHPRVNGQWGAEVMNLTRNVRIEGTEQGRAHVQFNHTSQPQQLRNLELRHMGPRQPTGEVGYDGAFTAGVMGRYPLHFHHNGSGSAGTLVENVVARDSGHRGFVAHASHGITFRGVIAHDVFDTPFWWDRREGLGHRAIWEPPSNDIVYDRAVASLVRTDPPFRGYRLAGFELGHGNDLSITNSVAVGVQGNYHAAGFNWPEGVAAESGDSSIGDHWHFQDNVAHNNQMNGIFTWQNTNDPRHVVEKSVMYHNGADGIIHGAYGNAYTYQELTLYGNGRNGMELLAQGDMRFNDISFQGAGISRYGFATGHHNGEASGAKLVRPAFDGYTDRGVAILSEQVEHLDIIDPVFSGPEASWFHVSSRASPNSIIRVQLTDGSAFRLLPANSTRGTAVPAWNARREAIAPFQ